MTCVRERSWLLLAAYRRSQQTLPEIVYLEGKFYYAVEKYYQGESHEQPA